MDYLHKTLSDVKEYKLMIDGLKDSELFKSAAKGNLNDILNCIAYAYARGLQDSINAQRDEKYRPGYVK